MFVCIEVEKCDSFGGHVHLSEGVQYNDSHLKGETLKVDSEFNRGESQSFTSSVQVADPSLCAYRQVELAYTDVEDSTNGNENKYVDTIASCSLHLPQFEMVKKETGFYMDKAVTEIDLPKMIVCYKEGSYHIIKDICVDQHKHYSNKDFIGNEAEDKKVYNESAFDGDECIKESHISDALKSSSLDGQSISDRNEDAKQDSFGSLPEKCKDTSDTSVGTLSDESNESRIDERMFSPRQSNTHQFQGHLIVVHNENVQEHTLASLLEEDRNKFDIGGEIEDPSKTNRLLPLEKFDSQHCHVDLSISKSNLDLPHSAKNGTKQPHSVNSDNEQPQSTKAESHSHQLQCVTGGCINVPFVVGKTDLLRSVCDSSNRELVDQCALEESKLTTSAVSPEVPKEENEAKNISSTKLESNIIVFDINSIPPATNPEKDINRVSEFQQSGLAASGTPPEDASTDGPGALAQTSLNHPGQSESNFLGPALFSGQTAYSGQIPYSGNISLRSDSSATSARSFAFPILQSEWNTSPVRMARADRKHSKKRRFWRTGFLCCKV